MEDALKYTLTAFASLLLLSSCSWFRNLERSLIEDDEKQMKRSGRAVPREQYDQLLVKYEELSKKYENLKTGKQEPEISLAEDSQVRKTNDIETVNLFPSETPAEKDVPLITNQEIPKDIESQLSLYRRAIALKTRNPGEATKLFQQLEGQAIEAVQARARYQLGEMLLSREQYDLALQIFEDVITKNASSGIVLDALKGAVQASEKLGLANKKDQYQSMLVDVFGQ